MLPGTTLLEAAGRAGIILQTPCGGKGTCGKCEVGIVPPGRDAATPPSGNGRVLACQTQIDGDMVVEIPRESLFEASEQILTGDAGTQAALEPVVSKRFFSLGAPTSEDAGADCARLKKALGPVEIPFDLLRHLPGFLRTNDWQGTAVLIGNRLARLEVGDTTDSACGVAVDLGTTTIVATLFDLVSGQELAIASAMNPQAGYGDDVIARIGRIRDNEAALADLQQVALEAVNGLVRDLVDEAQVSAQQIYEVVIAGNSTMQQILCGLDPSALGEVPFVQVFDSPLSIPASTLGIAASPAADVFVFPQIGGFVGGDTAAGMLAARMDSSDKPMLLVDIGTNGEIVLSHDGRFQATSTAAGPAFEGARIVQGMRATAGAIEKVVIEDDVLLNIIGNARPMGLCGTALIDAVAELLRQGIVDDTGRILSAEGAPSALPTALRERLVQMDREVQFLLVAAEESATGEPIYLWQKDVRELQLAAGAIRAGINILVRQAGLEPADLEAVLLAGAFGNYIRRDNARRIGLLPQIPCERIRFIGNAASMGAKLALLSAAERTRAADLARRTEHVDLSLDPDFQMEFGLSMMFPTADVDTCPDQIQPSA